MWAQKNLMNLSQIKDRRVSQFLTNKNLQTAMDRNNSAISALVKKDQGKISQFMKNINEASPTDSVQNQGAL